MSKLIPPYIVIRSFAEDEKQDMELMLSAGKLSLVLNDIYNICRENWKHDADAQECLDRVKDAVGEVYDLII